MDARVLALAKAADDGDGRYKLAHVRFRKKKPGVTEIAACNGQLLIEAEVADEATFAESDEPILVPAEACEHGLRILAAGYEGKHFTRGASISLQRQKGKDLLLDVTDGKKRTATLRTQAGEGSFPKTEDVWPKGDVKIVMKFDIDRLIEAISILRDVAGGESDLEATLTIYNEKKPVRFDCKDGEGQPVRALLMPLPVI